MSNIFDRLSKDTDLAVPQQSPAKPRHTHIPKRSRIELSQNIESLKKLVAEKELSSYKRNLIQSIQSSLTADAVLCEAVSADSLHTYKKQITFEDDPASSSDLTLWQEFIVSQSTTTDAKWGKRQSTTPRNLTSDSNDVLNQQKTAMTSVTPDDLRLRLDSLRQLPKQISTNPELLESCSSIQVATTPDLNSVTTEITESITVQKNKSTEEKSKTHDILAFESKCLDDFLRFVNRCPSAKGDKICADPIDVTAEMVVPKKQRPPLIEVISLQKAHATVINVIPSRKLNSFINEMTLKPPVEKIERPPSAGLNDSMILDMHDYDDESCSAEASSNSDMSADVRPTSSEGIGSTTVTDRLLREKKMQETVDQVVAAALAYRAPPSLTATERKLLSWVQRRFPDCGFSGDSFTTDLKKFFEAVDTIQLEHDQQLSRCEATISRQIQRQSQLYRRLVGLIQRKQGRTDERIRAKKARLKQLFLSRSADDDARRMTVSRTVQQSLPRSNTVYYRASGGVQRGHVTKIQSKTGPPSKSSYGGPLYQISNGTLRQIC